MWTGPGWRRGRLCRWCRLSSYSCSCSGISSKVWPVPLKANQAGGVRVGPVKIVRTEVLVVGGGTAGCVAALAAAEEGAKVILVENDAALGGVATRGGIHRYYYGSPGGLQEEIDRRTAEAASVFGGKTKGFHPDAKRVVLAALCREKGIEVYLNSVVYDVIKEETDVAGVRLLTPAGRFEIRAKVTIDSTGNAHLVRMAGGRLRYGRELDGVYHNYSLIPRRVLDGEIGYDNLDAGWVDPYDPWDVSRAFNRGREWVRQGYAEGAHYFALSSMLGVREGGLIEGDATITLEEYIEDRPSPEVICRSYSHLDNHGFDTGNESEFSQLWIAVMGLFVKGLWCDIPYGALLPAGIGNLLVAGRALSVDRDVGMGVRMQKDMHKVGEAAGVAAAMSSRSGRAPRELDRSGLQNRLVERGVLEAEDLKRTHGRNLRFKRGELAGVELGRKNAASYAEQLASYFGTDERWKAVWLLGSSAEALKDSQITLLLEKKLYEGTPEARFCAAITLAMLGREAAVPYLLERIAAKDMNKLSNHPKCVPFWIASFVLLRMLKSTAGVSQAAAAFIEQPGAVNSTFLLDYLSAVCPLLSAGERAEAAVQLRRGYQLVNLERITGCTGTGRNRSAGASG
ncbi:FAD-dependent oxidoreductase [Paenibacillus sp. DMB5]|uniref:FAD-dependent oxidoreductase n=1 Tax=Paenibacillus sp. DMB5 TaxID=1780103 RepID=UPI0009EAFB6B|nr:FAD-dependent oxidoreductase [Paenibacillus sp. DMB5]